MSITTELVDYVSELSRLKLPEEEKASMTAQLEQIIGYMDVLNTLDTSDIEPMSHTFPVKNVLREDEVEVFPNRDGLLAGAPAHDEEAFFVPKTVD